MGLLRISHFKDKVKHRETINILSVFDNSAGPQVTDTNGLSADYMYQAIKVEGSQQQNTTSK